MSVSLWIALAALAVLAVAVPLAVAAAKATRGRRATGVLSAMCPLTDREQAMYFRLRRALPGHVVLAQVAFSALLTTKDRPTRATFDRKVADFVLCDKAFSVLCAIELDDSTHRGREQRDASRDAMLRKAGIAVLRFKHVPDADVLIQAVSKIRPPSR
ncbi:MAG TPA: DUF2726 domain-containing protein [Roseateles sp.]